MEYAEWKRALRLSVQERMNYGRDYTDEEVEEVIDETLLDREDLALCPVSVRRRLKL